MEISITIKADKEDLSALLNKKEEKQTTSVQIGDITQSLLQVLRSAEQVQ